jgi:hypothetical protein
MTWLRSLTIAVACATGLPVAAHGRQAPPPESGDRLVDVKRVGSEVEMRDAAGGAPLLIPKGIPLWEGKNNPTALEPSIDIRAQPAGFVAVYTFSNTGPEPRALGALSLGVLTLGRRVDYPDLGSICEPRYADYTEGYKARQGQYPDTLYSPAWVLENQSYAVGVSLQYPILEYRHNVRLCLYSPEGRFAVGEGGRGWKLEFLLSNTGNDTGETGLAHSGLIEPGQTRTYTVSVRVTRKPAEWVRTLVPYRDWFRAAYGGVSYERQGGCIGAQTLASAALCGESNPLGFADSRPDLNGWGEAVGGLLARRGWDTLLFLNPSGSYGASRAGNPPYQFATNWNATGPLATACDPQIGFPRLPARAQKIGFRWGRSLQVARQWDDPGPVPFDPHNPDHRRLAFAEMDLAVKAGATTIALDAFSPRFTPLWDLVEWVADLKARYPGVRFAADAVSCDLIHRQIAAIYRGSKDRAEVAGPVEIDGFTNPHLMADFLLPGHETWGAFGWTAYDEFGITFTDQQKTDRLRQIAALGFTPCALEPFDLKDHDIQAAETWKSTVPADLRPGIGAGDDTDPFPTFGSFDAAFKAGAPAADLTRDGRLDFVDYTAWQNLHPPAGDGDQAGAPAGKPPPDKAAKPASSRHAVRAPTRPARPGTRKSARPARTPRMDIKVSGNLSGELILNDPRRNFYINSSPILFTPDEVAAAIARAKGLDDSAFKTTEADDSK